MPDDPALLQRVHETFAGYLMLGNDVERAGAATFVANSRFPNIYDANFASVGSHVDMDELLREMEERFAARHFRRVLCQPDAPPTVDARLVLEGFELDTELQLLLEGELAAEPPPVDLRLVQADDDDAWATIERLTRLDHEEEAVRFARRPYAYEVTEQLVASRRAKAPDLSTWMARVDGTDCAFFGSWPGENGVGKVEDLFTHPDFRHRGIATALIAHCVGDARERGAGPVVIGALVDDTPKRMYADLGFRPLYVTRSYLRRDQ